MELYLIIFRHKKMLDKILHFAPNLASVRINSPSLRYFHMFILSNNACDFDYNGIQNDMLSLFEA